MNIASFRRRWLPLGAGAILAVAVAGAAWWLAGGPPADGTPAPPAASRPLSPPAAPAERPAEAAPAVTDIFAQRTWEPPEPPAAAAPEAAAPAPEPAPEAPPLPFRYLGRVEEAGRPTVVFLARDDEVLAVHPGDSIDSAYRLIRLNDDEVYFLYRPLKIEQALSMGNTT